MERICSDLKVGESIDSYYHFSVVCYHHIHLNKDASGIVINFVAIETQGLQEMY